MSAESVELVVSGWNNVSSDVRVLNISSLLLFSLCSCHVTTARTYSIPPDDNMLSLGKAASTSRNAKSSGRSGAESMALA